MSYGAAPAGLYQAAIAGLSALGAELAGTQRKFDLDHMRRLMRALDDPQDRFRSVLITGTNGKGSTAATLASILASSRYCTGLYTSPHLLRVNERIRISSEQGQLLDVSDENFGKVYRRVNEASHALVRDDELPHMPSFFETVTAMAFLTFAAAGVDVAVLEVGLGGRLDATNIVHPLLSVITDVAMDHMEWLGDTIGAIAREKAGILRQDGVLVTLPQHPEANAAIGEVAVALSVTGINAAEYLPGHSPRLQQAGDSCAVTAFGTLLELSPQLPGEHQRRNLALALATAETLATRFGFDRITAHTTTHGVSQVRWPGRLEQTAVPGGAPVLLDVAHNPAGIWTLRSFLSRVFALPGTLPQPRTLVFSALADKAFEEMSQILFPLFDEPGDRVLLAPVANPRAVTAERLHALATTASNGARAKFSVFPSVAAVYHALSSQASGSIVVAGSVYLVSEWKTAALADAKGTGQSTEEKK